MRVTQAVLGLVVAAVGAGALAEAHDLDRFGAHGVPGPGFFPDLVAAALVLLGLLLALVNLVRRGGGDRSLAARPVPAGRPDTDPTTDPSAVPDAAPATSAATTTAAPAGTAPEEATPDEAAADEATAAGGHGGPVGFERSALLRAGRVWLGFVVAIPLLVLVGFAPAMLLLVAYLVFAVERIRGVRPVLATILIPAGVYLLFAMVLGVELPGGVLFGAS